MRDFDNEKPKWPSKSIHFNNLAEKEKFTNMAMSFKLSSGVPIGTIVNEALELYIESKKAGRKTSKKVWEE